MASNQFSVGRDLGAAIIDHPFVGRLELRHVTGFEATQEQKSPQVDRLDGRVLTRHVPKGWKGGFDLDRADDSVDQLSQAFEDAAFNRVPVPYGTITYFIAEQDGSTSTYLLEDVSIKITSVGKFAMDDAVKQRVEFNASRRRRI